MRGQGHVRGGVRRSLVVTVVGAGVPGTPVPEGVQQGQPLLETAALRGEPS